MAGGGFAVDNNAGDFGGRITMAVVLTCIVAASGGLIFGYDIGISGGVTTMIPFLHKFFPSILRKAADAKTNVYCVYDSQALTAFTSSLYIAGLVASLAASRLTATFGRKFTMILGGCTFLVGAAINGGSENVAMLIIGRIFLGFGVGFTNQATPMYISEVAPAKWRGAFNTGFQFFIGVGVVAANFINYGTSKLTWGWRLSLGLAVAPAVIMTLGTLLISDTPSSLVERGKLDHAKCSLAKIRGRDDNGDVEAEFAALVKANEAAREAHQEPFVTIFETRYRPYLVMAVMIPFFQQMTGINIIAFYAPVLFQSVGFGSDTALMASIILGAVNLGSTLVSTLLVDRRVRVVMGPTQLVGPKRDLPLENQADRAEYHGGSQLCSDVCVVTDVPNDVVPLQVRGVPVLRGLDCGDDGFRVAARARDERGSSPVHASCVEEALVLAEREVVEYYRVLNKLAMVSFHTPLSQNQKHHHHHSMDSEIVKNLSKKRKWDEAVPHNVDYDRMIKPWMSDNSNLCKITRSSNSSSVDLHLEFPLPSDWQRCLDIQSGEIHFYNTRTHKRTQRDPRLPSTLLNLDLELNIAHGDDQDITTTKNNNNSANNKKIPTLSLFSSSSSLQAAEMEQQEMVAAACKRCHLLVMLSKKNPACPNCKFMHPADQSPPNLFKPRLSLLC
ncbi:hypothetical protein V2J09_013850 [Rumex salicifolius]